MTIRVHYNVGAIRLVTRRAGRPIDSQPAVRGAKAKRRLLQRIRRVLRRVRWVCKGRRAEIVWMQAAQAARVKGSGQQSIRGGRAVVGVAPLLCVCVGCG